MSDHYVAFSNVCAPERRIERDHEIVSTLQAGSRADFKELHATYSRRLYKVIIAITKNPEDAEDALQETFLRAYLGIHAFEGRSTIYSWLTRIAINSALMTLRKRRIRSEILFDVHPDASAETFCLEFQDPSLNPEQICDLRQRLAKVESVIRNLGPHLQEPLWMQIEKEASIEEISQALKITRAAVKSRLHRARQRLSARWDIKRFATNHQGLIRATAESATVQPAPDPSQISSKSASE